MREIIRGVVIQHVLQMAVGIALATIKPETCIGREEYDIQRWAQWIRLSQAVIPWLLLTLEFDSQGLANRVQFRFPALAGLVAGGKYSSAMQFSIVGASAPSYASWEMALARTIY
jgi:sphinganine C4-monooxygenase